MNIGEIERTRRIELPARETERPERKRIERTEPAETPTTPAPTKVPAGPDRREGDE